MLAQSANSPQVRIEAQYVLYSGRKCRVLRYLHSGFFSILDRNDEVRHVHRSRLTFL